MPFTPLKDDLADVAGCAEVLQGLWCLGQRKHLVYGCDRASLERGPGTPMSPASFGRHRGTVNRRPGQPVGDAAEQQTNGLKAAATSDSRSWPSPRPSTSTTTPRR